MKYYSATVRIESSASGLRFKSSVLRVGAKEESPQLTNGWVAIRFIGCKKKPKTLNVRMVCPLAVAMKLFEDSSASRSPKPWVLPSPSSSLY